MRHPLHALPRTARSGPRRQRGGFAIGLVVGLLLGLALSLGVALYVTKVPVPFINKVPQRSAEQDAAEAERMRQWDPNAPLQGKAPNTPPVPGVTPPPLDPNAAPTGPAVTGPVNPGASAARAARDPAAILSGGAVGGASAPQALEYFVQAGAFSRSDDAERQRASLAMLGFGAKVSEREQAGRTIYRVRLGPFAKKADADAAREALDGNGIQAAVVHAPKSLN